MAEALRPRFPRAPVPGHWRERVVALGGVRTVHPIHGAGLLRTRGEHELAIEALYEVLAREPYHVDGLNHIVGILSALGRQEALLPFRRRLHEIRCQGLGLEGAERDATILFLEAAFGAGPLPKRAPNGLIRATFDQYADFYDVRLRTHLAYRAPELVSEAVRATSQGREQGLEFLDLGCGTGLLAPLLRSNARRLVGIDLSSRMLERAHERDIYDDLHEAEFIGWLEANKHRWDVIVAADALCYVGGLGPLLDLVAARLGSMGRFVFTVERSASHATALHPTERFVHSEEHVRRVAEAAHLDVRYLVQRALRNQNGRPVDGLVVVLQRRSANATPK